MENDKFNEYPNVAMKVNKVRAVRADISRKIRFISAASFFGLSDCRLFFCYGRWRKKCYKGYCNET